jgi:hemoglobin/transferrin/lactoferrin receptor protein
MNPPFPRRHWLALLLLSPSLALAAEPKADEPAARPTQFDTVTVTATRNATRVGEVPNVVSVISERQIDQGNVNSIADLVRHEPGVSVSGTGSRFGLSGFNIRGIDGNRVLTQVDGVSVPQGYSFSPFQEVRRDYIDVDTLKQVEIIRGPASSLYGSDAIGGAVSFLTKDAADYLNEGDDAFARLKTGYNGSDNSWLTSGTLAGRQDNLDALLHVGRIKGDETATASNRGGTGLQRGEANPLDYTTQNLLTKLGWDHAPGSRLQLTYEHYRDESDSDLLSNINTTATMITPAILDSQASDNIDRDRFSLEHWLQLDAAWADSLRWQLSHQDSDNRQQTGQIRETLFGVQRYRYRDSHYNEKLWNLNAQLDKAFTALDSEHLLVWGLDAQRIESSNLRTGHEVRLDTGAPVPSPENFPVSDFPDPTSDTYGLFVQDSIGHGRLTLIPGLRYDHYELKPDVTDEYLRGNPPQTDPSTSSDQQLSPKLGATWQLTSTESLFGQYAAGFRAPSPVYMFGEFDNPGLGYRQIGNPDLQPETSNSYEVGLRGQHKIGSYELAAFYNQYDDFIEQQLTAAPGYYIGQLQWVNIDRATIRGAEAKGELFLEQFALPAGSKLLASIAYARGEDEDSVAPLNSVDPLKAVLGLGYDEPSGLYGGALHWTLVQNKTRIDYDENPNGTQFATPGYGTLDITGWVQLTEQVSINAGIYNLTDKKYWQWGDVQGLTNDSASLDRFTQPGRYAAANLIWEI